MSTRIRSSVALESSERLLIGSTLGLPLVTSVGSIRSRSASRITWHHHDEFEILFLVDGVTEYEFVGGRKVSLAGGHFLVVPPGTRHRGLDDVRRPARLCGIVFDSRRAGAAKLTPFSRDDLRRLTEAFAGFDGSPRPMSIELRRIVGLMMRQIHDFRQTSSDGTALRLSLCSTLWEAARQLTIDPTVHSDEAVQRACEYMKLHLSDEISMNTLARPAVVVEQDCFESSSSRPGKAPMIIFNDFALLEPPNCSARPIAQSPTSRSNAVSVRASISASSFESTRDVRRRLFDSSRLTKAEFA